MALRKRGAYDDIGLEKTDTPDAHVSGRTFRDFIAGLTARTGYTLNSDGQTRFGSSFRHKC
jgi:hypothetical protein